MNRFKKSSRSGNKILGDSRKKAIALPMELPSEGGGVVRLQKEVVIVLNGYLPQKLVPVSHCDDCDLYVAEEFQSKQVVTVKIGNRTEPKIRGELFYWEKLNCAHMIELTDWFCYDQFVYFVSPHYGNGSLYDVFVRADQEKLKPNELMVRKWTKQLLIFLNRIHSMGLYHLNVGKKDLFLDNNSNLKVGGLGYMTLYNDNRALLGHMDHVPPEVLQNWPYSTGFDLSKIDMWAVGGLICELLTGFSISGSIQGDSLADRLNRRLFIHHNVESLLSQPAISNLSRGSRGFISWMLKWEPTARPTARQALKHPWLRDQEIRLELHQLDRCLNKVTGRTMKIVPQLSLTNPVVPLVPPAGVAVVRFYLSVKTEMTLRQFKLGLTEDKIQFSKHAWAFRDHVLRVDPAREAMWNALYEVLMATGSRWKWPPCSEPPGRKYRLPTKRINPPENSQDVEPGLLRRNETEFIDGHNRTVENHEGSLEGGCDDGRLPSTNVDVPEEEEESSEFNGTKEMLNSSASNEEVDSDTSEKVESLSQEDPLFSLISAEKSSYVQKNCSIKDIVIPESCFKNKRESNSYEPSFIYANEYKEIIKEEAYFYEKIRPQYRIVPNTAIEASNASLPCNIRELREDPSFNFVPSFSSHPSNCSKYKYSGNIFSAGTSFQKDNDLIDECRNHISTTSNSNRNKRPIRYFYYEYDSSDNLHNDLVTQKNENIASDDELNLQNQIESLPSTSSMASTSTSEIINEDFVSNIAPVNINLQKISAEEKESTGINFLLSDEEYKQLRDGYSANTSWRNYNKSRSIDFNKVNPKENLKINLKIPQICTAGPLLNQLDDNTKLQKYKHADERCQTLVRPADFKEKDLSIDEISSNQNSSVDSVCDHKIVSGMKANNYLVVPNEDLSSAVSNRGYPSSESTLNRYTWKFSKGCNSLQPNFKASDICDSETESINDEEHGKGHTFHSSASNSDCLIIFDAKQQSSRKRSNTLTENDINSCSSKRRKIQESLETRIVERDNISPVKLNGKRLWTRSAFTTVKSTTRSTSVFRSQSDISVPMLSSTISDLHNSSLEQSYESKDHGPMVLMPQSEISFVRKNKEEMKYFMENSMETIAEKRMGEFDNSTSPLNDQVNEEQKKKDSSFSEISEMGTFFNLSTSDMSSARKPRRPFSASSPNAAVEIRTKKSNSSVSTPRNNSNDQCKKMDCWPLMESLSQTSGQRTSNSAGEMPIALRQDCFEMDFSTIEPINSLQTKDLLAPFIIDPWSQIRTRTSLEIARMLALLIEPLQSKRTKEIPPMKFSFDEQCSQFNDKPYLKLTCSTSSFNKNIGRKFYSLESDFRYNGRRKQFNPILTDKRKMIKDKLGQNNEKYSETLNFVPINQDLNKYRWPPKQDNSTNHSFAFPIQEKRSQKRTYSAVSRNAKRIRKYAESSLWNEDQGDDNDDSDKRES